MELVDSAWTEVSLETDLADEMLTTWMLGLPTSFAKLWRNKSHFFCTSHSTESVIAQCGMVGARNLPCSGPCLKIL